MYKVSQFEIFDGRGWLPGTKVAEMFHLDPNLCEVEVEGELLKLTQPGENFSFRTPSWRPVEQ